MRLILIALAFLCSDSIAQTFSTTDTTASVVVRNSPNIAEWPRGFDCSIDAVFSFALGGLAEFFCDGDTLTEPLPPIQCDFGDWVVVLYRNGAGGIKGMPPEIIAVFGTTRLNGFTSLAGTWDFSC